MKDNVKIIFDDLFIRYPLLDCVKNQVENAYCFLENTYNKGGKILLCGNGGSAADCEHIVGELMKSFRLERRLDEVEVEAFKEFPDGEKIATGLQKGLRAISLVSQTSLLTAVINDCDPDLVFAQQVYNYMDKNDTLIALSTSGNSGNIINAAITARAVGGKVIAVTNECGGKLSGICDETIKLPFFDTPAVQEYTLPLYHTLCAMLEENFFGE